MTSTAFSRKSASTIQCCFALVLAVAWLAAAHQAQTVAPISGHVHDQNGNPVAAAKVRFNADSGSLSTSQTDTDGSFVLQLSGPGVLTIDSIGFARYEQRVAHDGNKSVDVVLVPLSISESVTITRTSGALESTPASVVALDRQQLETTPAQTLDDKLRQVPGFSLFRRAGSRTANPTTQGVSLRGVGASGASRALMLNDGVPLNDPFGGWIYWGRVPSESMASVEVLRGTAGDLYGSSAIGGVVSITTRKEVNAVASIESSYGLQNSPSISSFGSLRFRPVIASLGFEAFRTDGFIPVAPESRGPVDTPANSKRFSVVPAFSFSFSDLEISLKGTFYEEHRENGTPLQKNDTRLKEFVAAADRGTRKLGEFAFRTYFLGQTYDQTFSAVAANRQSESLNRLQNVPSEAFGSSLFWHKAFGQQLQTFSGAEFRNVRGRSDETAVANGRATSLASAGGRELTFGAFAGIQASPTDRLIVTGGLRYDRWHDVGGYSATRSLVTGVSTRQTFPDRTQTALSPRISALFRLSPNINVSAAFSRGFRQPTLNELYRSFRVGDVLTNANAGLRAERATTFETAVAVRALDDKARFRTGFFATEIGDAIANVTLTITPTLITRQRQNMGRVLSRGVEIDGDVRVSNDFSVSGGYLFVDSAVTSFPADSSLVGLRVPQIPRQQGSVMLNYHRPRFVTVSAQFRATSLQFDDDQNRFPLRGFYTVDIFASRQITKWVSLFGAVENLFDHRIEAGRTPVLTLAGPRSARFGIRLNFGRK